VLVFFQHYDPGNIMSSNKPKSARNCYHCTCLSV